MTRLKVEFHCHSEYSPDSLSGLVALRAAARRKGIDRLVISDHNTARGGLAAVALDSELFIAGEEIYTTAGELLAVFVQEEVPRGLPPEEAIRRLRAQGAFITVPHPFDRERKGWLLADLLEIAPLVDAVEVFNSRCINPEYNQQALVFAEKYDLAQTVGSDAHAPFEVGQAYLTLPTFSTAAELKTVIRQGEANVRVSPPWVHFVSVGSRWWKKIRPPTKK